MATKKRSSAKRRVKVNKLKVGKDKIEELSGKDAKRIRGGQSSDIILGNKPPTAK